MNYRVHDIAKFFFSNVDKKLQNQLIQNVEIDSRHVLNPETTMFVCLKGSHVDGHDFIEELIQKGVKLFLISEQKYLKTGDACFILVDDVLLALQSFANFHRSHFSIPIIGVTGSNGKTIVKEWLAIILSKKYRVCKNPKSFNSQIGVALSLLELAIQDEIGIFEAGISNAGEMNVLQKMMLPSHGIFTSLGDAHQSGFTSLEEKFYEKLNLFSEAEMVILKEAEYTKNLQGKKYGFISNTNTLFEIIEKKIYHDKTIITLNYLESVHQFNLPFVDEASVDNAVLAIAAGLYFSVENSLIQEALDGFHNLPMRLELKEGLRQCNLINDSYSLDIKSLELALRFMDNQNQTQSRSIILTDFPSIQHDEHLFKHLSHLFIKYGIAKIVIIGNLLKGIQPFFDSNIQVYTFSKTEQFIDNLTTLNFHNELILVKGARTFGLEKFIYEYSASQHEAFLEIDIKALENNINKLKSKLDPNTKVMAIVKAAAYGSGHYEIAQFLERKKIDYFGVAYADEGILLRQKGIQTPILVMNTGKSDFALMSEYRLEPEVYSLLQCNQIDKEILENEVIHIHIKLDTGMHRLGFLESEIDQLLKWLVRRKNSVTVKSIFSHLAGSDDPKLDSVSIQQNELFKRMAASIMHVLDYKPWLHLLNSNGIIRFQSNVNFQYDMVRFGIGMYGVGVEDEHLGLEKVHTLKAKVLQIKSIKAGEYISYNQSGKMNHDGKIAILSIGYSDGIPRSLYKGDFHFFINGKLVPIIGLICMDFCMVDISEAGVVIEGMDIEIFGKNVDIHGLARSCDTIPYEILTGISTRVKRVFIQD